MRDYTDKVPKLIPLGDMLMLLDEEDVRCTAVDPVTGVNCYRRIGHAIPMCNNCPDPNACVKKVHIGIRPKQVGVHNIPTQVKWYGDDGDA